MLFKLMQTFGLMKFVFPAAARQLVVLLSLVLFTTGFSVKEHPFYVTVIEVNHNSKEKNLEISCKIFADDLENTLKKNYKIPLDISHPKDPKQLDKMVNEYCTRHLQLKVDGKPVTLQYVGFEKEAESAWCYFQVPGISTVKKLDATTDLLYEMYDSQISILHASVGGVRKSLKLEYPATQMSFSW